MRVLLPVLCIALLAGCQEEDAAEAAYKKSPRADVRLKKAGATLTQTSNTEWSLDKVGSLGGASITWQATATQGATTSGLLILNGVFTVENKGNAGAPIGNIVVNIQKRVGWKWVTVSSDIADATQDDAATTANVAAKNCSDQTSTFTENSASGSLLFTDAKTNSAFALVPQVTLAPKTTKKLRFTATFDNNILDLPTYSLVRAEILVSFGNAKSGGASAHKIDINGNGIIDADERWIRTVDERIITWVPPQKPSNSTVTLTDTPSDITTTGTVTFTNPVIVINGLQALVTVNYNGGASGGTITNCAHLTGSGSSATCLDDDFNNVTAIDLTSCSTITVGPHTCAPGAPGCGWEDGDMVTYNQDSWGTLGTTASNLLANEFFAVYPNGVEIGIIGAGGNSAIFNTPEAVLDYQPTSGSPGPLDNDLQDPTSTSAGAFGGHVLALQLDVDFYDANKLSGTASLEFGDLRVCALTGATATFNGQTVRQVLAGLNLALGDEVNPYDFEALSTLAQDLSQSFEGGAVSVFAQQHVFNATTCP
jgi:hypothetical protein